MKDEQLFMECMKCRHFVVRRKIGSRDVEYGCDDGQDLVDYRKIEFVGKAMSYFQEMTAVFAVHMQRGSLSI